MRNYAVLLISAIALTLSLSPSASTDWRFEKLSETLYGSMYYDLCIYRDHLICAAKRAVEIYSLEDPENPTLVAQAPTPGLANGVWADGDYLYVGDVYYFHIYDISDFANPILLGTFKGNETGYPERVRVRGNYAYVAAYNAGLQVFDISDKTNPVLIGSGDTPAYAWYVGINNTTAVIADTFSIEIFDITNPALPLHQASYSAMFALELEVSNNLVYVAFIDGMVILDITDPANPVKVGAPGITGTGVSQTVAVQGNYAYVGHQSYLDIYDIANPAEPKQVGYLFTRASTRAVRVLGNYAYIAEDEAGIEIVDITDPTKPEFVQLFNPYGDGTRADVVLSANPGVAYLADGRFGIKTINYTDPTSPTVVGGYNVPGNTYSINIFGDVMVAGAQRWLEFLSLAADPLNPEPIGSYRNTGNPLWGIVANNVAYLADTYSIQSLDITDPANPIRLDAYFTDHAATPYRIYQRGTVLYVAASSGGLMLFSCADPANLELLSQVPTDHSKTYLTLGFVGNYLYAPDGDGTIDIYNPANPNDPVLVKSVPIEGDFPRILIDGNRAFLSNQSQGVKVLDVSDPLNPAVVGSTETSGYAEGIAVDNDLLLVADVYSFQIFRLIETEDDVTPPATSIMYPQQGQKIEGKFADLFGYSIDHESGVKVVEISTNGGTSWKNASGTETWSYRYYPRAHGEQIVLARGIDYKENIENPPAWVSFPFSLLAPMILVGGYWDTYLPYTGNLRITALVQDPIDVATIDRVELYYDGLATGVELDLVDLPAGTYALFETDFAWGSSPEATYLIELVPFDVFDNPGGAWPFVNVPE